MEVSGSAFTLSSHSEVGKTARELFQGNDHGSENRGGQFGNRGASDNFNRGDRRHGRRLNCLKVQFDQDDLYPKLK
ncbi:hypothetical protein TNCV_818501 [Trichonephila clavipes]|nr:hypothetical protein TNCV_818501 [Trichonephila clavipes]